MDIEANTSEVMEVATDEALSKDLVMATGAEIKKVERARDLEPKSMLSGVTSSEAEAEARIVKADAKETEIKVEASEVDAISTEVTLGETRAVEAEKIVISEKIQLMATDLNKFEVFASDYLSTMSISDYESKTCNDEQTYELKKITSTEDTSVISKVTAAEKTDYTKTRISEPKLKKYNVFVANYEPPRATSTETKELATTSTETKELATTSTETKELATEELDTEELDTEDTHFFETELDTFEAFETDYIVTRPMLNELTTIEIVDSDPDEETQGLERKVKKPRAYVIDYIRNRATPDKIPTIEIEDSDIEETPVLKSKTKKRKAFAADFMVTKTPRRKISSSEIEDTDTEESEIRNSSQEFEESDIKETHVLEIEKPEAFVADYMRARGTSSKITKTENKKSQAKKNQSLLFKVKKPEAVTSVKTIAVTGKQTNADEKKTQNLSTELEKPEATLAVTTAKEHKLIICKFSKFTENEAHSALQEQTDAVAADCSSTRTIFIKRFPAEGEKPASKKNKILSGVQKKTKPVVPECISKRAKSAEQEQFDSGVADDISTGTTSAKRKAGEAKEANTKKNQVSNTKKVPSTKQGQSNALAIDYISTEVISPEAAPKEAMQIAGMRVNATIRKVIRLPELQVTRPRLGQLLKPKPGSNSVYTINTINLFTADAKRAIAFLLVHNIEDVITNDLPYPPTTTKFVCGPSEKIFGYHNLTINLFYCHTTLECYVEVKYDAMYLGNGNGRPPDMIELLKPYLPSDHFTSREFFVTRVNAQNSERQFGQRLAKFELPNTHRSVSKYNFTVCMTVEQDFAQFQKRFQTILLWYQDDAELIDISGPNWIFFHVYEVYPQRDGKKSKFPVGFVSVLKLSIDQETVMCCICQLFVLPQYQRMGIGTKMLQQTYTALKTVEGVRGIVYAKCNPAFIRLKDYCDTLLLSTLPEFQPPKVHLEFNLDMERAAFDNFLIIRRQAIRIHRILRVYYCTRKTKREGPDFEREIKAIIGKLDH